MNDNLGSSDEEVAAIIAALDKLVDAVEKHGSSLQAEQPAAHATGDPKYIERVDRGIGWTQELLDVLDDDVLERIGSLRHNARQLGVAREGKLV